MYNTVETKSQEKFLKQKYLMNSSTFHYPYPKF